MGPNGTHKIKSNEALKVIELLVNNAAISCTTDGTFGSRRDVFIRLPYVCRCIHKFAQLLDIFLELCLMDRKRP